MTTDAVIVTSNDNNNRATVFYIQCVASMKTAVYEVRVCFNVPMECVMPYECYCSCPDGQNAELCSHQIGLVTLIYMIADRSDISNLHEFQDIFPDNVLNITSETIPMIFYSSY